MEKKSTEEKQIDYPRFWIRHSMTGKKFNEHTIYLLEQMRCEGSGGVERDTKIWEKLGIWDNKKDGWEIIGAIEKENINAKFAHVGTKETKQRVVLVNAWISAHPSEWEEIDKKNTEVVRKITFLKIKNQDHLALMKSRADVGKLLNFPVEIINNYSSDLNIFT